MHHAKNRDILSLSGFYVSRHHCVKCYAGVNRERDNLFTRWHFAFDERNIEIDI